MRIATLNIGSATVKVSVVECTPGSAVVMRRVVEGIDAAGGLSSALARAIGSAEMDAVEAVGHRVVHGGTRFLAPVRIEASVQRALEGLTELAPLHMPPALAGIRFAGEHFAGVPMVAVFDTAFHAGRSPESMRYALPWDLADELGLFRFGFHGIAHASLLESLAAEEGTPASRTSAVTLQLGAGCSACAIRAGRSIETSMGFTPLEGLPMATRSGDVDPGVLLELLRRGRSPAKLDELLSRRSGWLGLAGSADLRVVLRSAAADEERAAVAVALFVRRLVTTIGAYLTLLDGDGSIVFGGGIGAGSPEIRRRVAAGLRAWNVALDPALDVPGARGRISRPGSRPVYVFETDEERIIGRSVFEVLGEGA